MIYVASPYSDPSPVIREKRYQAVMQYTANLIRRGLVAYSPIVHCHVMAQQYDLPTGHDFWFVQNFGMLDKADSMRVLTLAGWGLSKGVDMETRYAKSRNIPVTYHHENEDE